MKKWMHKRVANSRESIEQARRKCMDREKWRHVCHGHYLGECSQREQGIRDYLIEYLRSNKHFLSTIYIRGGGDLVASSQTDKLRVPSLNPSTGWPLFFGKTAEWPKITYMLPLISSTGLQHYMHRGAFTDSMSLSTRKNEVTKKI